MPPAPPAAVPRRTARRKGLPGQEWRRGPSARAARATWRVMSSGRRAAPPPTAPVPAVGRPVRGPATRPRHRAPRGPSPGVPSAGPRGRPPVPPAAATRRRKAERGKPPRNRRPARRGARGVPPIRREGREARKFGEAFEPERRPRRQARRPIPPQPPAPRVADDAHGAAIFRAGPWRDSSPPFLLDYTTAGWFALKLSAAA